MSKFVTKDLFEITPEIAHLAALCEESNAIDRELYGKYDVKRGLRDMNGKGVLAGLTNVSDVRAKKIVDGEEVPCPGNLYYRGYNIKDLVNGFLKEDHYGFEEIAYLLLFGELPTRQELADFQVMLSDRRTLPPNFVRDVIMKAPSRDMMNSQDLFIYAPRPELSMAENILMMLREDRQYTKLEAKILDMAMVLHMDHGGGNNSTFTTHVVTSSGTDTYSTMTAAMASLKGPKHGGANIKVTQMFEDMKGVVNDWEDEDEIRQYLYDLLDKKAFDQKGLIYGMVHAVYSVSDPRAEIFKGFVEQLAVEKGYEKEYSLYSKVERLAPEVIGERRRMYKGVNANVDFYSGLVYQMLNLPQALYTPIFAAARIVGWRAHRLEELKNVDKIIRPAYKALAPHRDYIEMDDRGDEVC